jgi:hypothetical protein
VRRSYGNAAPVPNTAAAGVPLTVQEKLDVVRKVGALIAGPRGYTFTADLGGDLEWGMVAFRQSAGTLGAVIDVLRTHSPDVLDQAFGGSGEELHRVLTAPSPSARLAPVEGQALASAGWRARFEAAAALDGVKFAQNRAAVERLVDPLLDMIVPLTDRNLAVALAAAAALGGEEVRAVGLAGLPARAAGTPLADRLAAIEAAEAFHDTLFARG